MTANTICLIFHYIDFDRTKISDNYNTMDGFRPCGCKGSRTCLLCEKQFNLKQKPFIDHYKNLDNYVFCYECNRIYSGDYAFRINEEHPNHDNKSGLELPGVYIQPDFISLNEEKILMNGIDGMSWDTSQSGRRKQHFGPKTNFKKMKLSPGTFGGFPSFSKFVQERFKTVPLLSDYQTIEQCSLEYDPGKGASIDPHIDDCWIWGERIVTVNCLSDCVLTLVKYRGDPKRYNLPIVDSYESKLIAPLMSTEQLNKYSNALIKIPMPNRSLIILYGPPRYQFEHSVLRNDVTKRRVCIAYRDFTPLYLPHGEHHGKGEPILEIARNFRNENISGN